MTEEVSYGQPLLISKLLLALGHLYTMAAFIPVGSQQDANPHVGISRRMKTECGSGSTFGVGGAPTPPRNLWDQPQFFSTWFFQKSSLRSPHKQMAGRNPLSG